jgi:TonB-linked SusC/RagA family outer membrane protein
MNLSLKKRHSLLPIAKAFVFSTVLAGGCVISANAEPLPAAAAETPVSGKISGTVVDSTGEPVIGASVLVKGTQNGTSTDMDGNFTLTNVKGGALVISYVGMKTQEINIAGKTHIDVTLEDNAEMLSEVVVVGYGTQKKETMTGAVTAIGSKELENKGTLSSPLQALQGQVPGVIITRSSTAPGDESWGMTLRGKFSKNSSDPLIIIDGVEYESVNELRLLNPSDIESINFLKDAAASIYGSKAAGGVVLVTTKKAKDGKFRVDYSGSVTGKFKGMVQKKLNLEQWANATIEARTNDGYDDTDTWIKYAKFALQYPNQYLDWNYTGNPFNGSFSDTDDMTFFDTDWDDILWGDSSSTQQELAITGGREGNTFRLSLGYMHDGSNLKWGNNFNNRYNIRLTNSVDFTKWFHLESVVGYNRQHQVAPTMISSALNAAQQPGFPSCTVNGLPYAWGTWKTPNWQCELGGDNTLNVSALNISENLTFKLYDTLALHTVFGYNTSAASRDTYRNNITFYNYAGTDVVAAASEKAADSYYEKSNSRTDFYSIQAYLDWNRTFNKVHNLKLMAGWQYNLKQYDYVKTKVTEIQEGLEVINGSGTVTYESSAWEEAMMSIYGRANYDYDNKYLVEGQFRRDGSSKFTGSNRWANFGGVSVGWRVMQEDFAAGLRDWWDEFKIRLSYGTVGNQSGIDRYSGAMLYNLVSNGGALVGDEMLSYIETNGKLVSTNRTWERIHNYNLGVDFGFLNNRLSGTFELFEKKLNNMLIDVQYPSVLGATAPTGNYGKFKAWGYEGQITWRDHIGNVNYYVGGTITYADNKLLDNGTENVAIQTGVRSDREGYPLNSVFGFRYAGKIQDDATLDAYKERFADGYSGEGNINLIRKGDNMFEDVNGDGKLDENDIVYLGTEDPKIQFSFNAGFEWKGFDVGVVFQGAAKRTIWRRESSSSPDPWRIPTSAAYKNSSNIFLGNVWSEDNPNGFYPSLTNQSGINNYNYQCSSWSVQDGSYIRLKNITVGYTLPKNIVEKTKCLTNVRFSVTASDVWEWCKTTDGYDPEANGVVSGSSKYPFTRNVTFGLNVSF